MFKSVVIIYFDRAQVSEENEEGKRQHYL